jgi:hypothetical protein
MAYSFGVLWMDPYVPPEGGPAVLPKATKSYRLVVERSGKAEVIIDQEEPYRYRDWILAPSGRFIVVVRLQAEGERAYTNQLTRSVYRYDLSSRRSTKLFDVTGYGIVDDVPMHLSADETRITWLRYSGRELRRLVLDLGSGATQDQLIYTKSSSEDFPVLADRDMLSPNHRLGVLGARDGADWKIKLLDMESGRLTDLVNLGPRQASLGLRWSADGASIAYAAAPFGGGDGFGQTLSMGLVDVRTRAKTILATSTRTDPRITPGGCLGGIQPIAFSPDGRWLAYARNCRLGLYDLARRRPGPSIDDLPGQGPYPPGYAWVGF